MRRFIQTISCRPLRQSSFMSGTHGSVLECITCSYCTGLTPHSNADWIVRRWIYLFLSAWPEFRRPLACSLSVSPALVRASPSSTFNFSYFPVIALLLVEVAIWLRRFLLPHAICIIMIDHLFNHLRECMCLFNHELFDIFIIEFREPIHSAFRFKCR
jgi:hypothetical protein